MLGTIAYAGTNTSTHDITAPVQEHTTRNTADTVTATSRPTSATASLKTPAAPTECHHSEPAHRTSLEQLQRTLQIEHYPTAKSSFTPNIVETITIGSKFNRMTLPHKNTMASGFSPQNTKWSRSTDAGHQYRTPTCPPPRIAPPAIYRR